MLPACAARFSGFGNVHQSLVLSSLFIAPLTHYRIWRGTSSNNFFSIKLYISIISHITTITNVKLENHWHDIINRRKYFEQYARSKGFDPLVPDNWYAVQVIDLLRHKVSFFTIIIFFIFLFFLAFSAKPRVECGWCLV